MIERESRFDQRGADGCQVIAHLRDKVWQLQRSAEGLEMLERLREVLQVSGVPLRGCGLYVVERESQPPAVRFHPLRPEGEWREVGAEEKAAVLRAWKGGAGESIPAPVAGADGGEDAELRVPFAHGLLVLTGLSSAALSIPEIEVVEEVVGVLSDLFRRLEDLQRLEALEWQLCQLQSLAAVGQLAAEAAHEINSPLCALLGECSLLLEEELAPGVREGLETLYRAGMQARTISSRMLSFARPQAPRQERLELNQLVHDVLHLVRRQFEKKNIELVEELEEDLPRIGGYASQLQQVVLNLVQNSQEAILSARGMGRIWVRTYAREEGVILEVEDDGPGIPEMIREQIFEPFFTTKGGDQGSGLGLSVCQRIVHIHGGHLRLEPRAWGTCMVVELPFLDEVHLACPGVATPLATMSSA